MARTPKFTAKDRLEIFKLKAQGQTAKAIGERYGVSHTTVNNQLTDLEHEVANSFPMVRQYLSNLEIILGDKMRMVLDGITEEKAAEANLVQLATALTMLNNMLRLETNQSTTSPEVKYSRVDLDEYRRPVDTLPAQLANASIEALK
jgi:hypothetical protein